MHLIYEAPEKTNGDRNGETPLTAMKGLSWTRMCDPITIDADTRDVIQDFCIRKSTEVNGQIWDVEFDKIAQFEDLGV